MQMTSCAIVDSVRGKGDARDDVRGIGQPLMMTPLSGMLFLRQRTGWTSSPNARISTRQTFAMARTAQSARENSGGVEMSDATSGLQLRSLIKKSGELELSLMKVPTPEP